MQVIQISEPTENNAYSLANKIILGIDFGTTNSLVAYSVGQQVRFFTDENNKDIIPSIVNYSNEKTKVEEDNEQVSIHSIKRLLAKDTEEIINSDAITPQIKDLLVKDSKSIKLQIAGKNKTPTEVASEIFRYLKSIAERNLGSSVKEVVVTVPAYFDNAARGEVIKAARIAGLEVLRLIAEPTAAAYAYGLNKEARGYYLVYDLGGGTFDVSVLNMQKGVLQVIATGGNNMLGGDDIDLLLANYLITKYSITPANLQKLYMLARMAKENLSSKNEFTAEIMINHQAVKISLDKEELNKVIKPVIVETIHVVKDTLQQAEDPNLEGIILVGGSTRIPLIKEELSKHFSVPIFSNIDPDRVVALGAALQAENLTTKSGHLLIDVTPLSLGIELYGGLVEKIIMRNTPIPASFTKEFTTYADNQTAMQLHIVQGEREMVTDCRSLGKFELKDIPPMKAGTARIEVKFAIDCDGLLSVTALEKVTNKYQQIEINPSFGLSNEEINEILEQSYKNAAIDHENRLLRETIIEAEGLIYSLQQALKEMPDIASADYIEQIKQAISKLQESIKSNVREQIILLTKNLDKISAEFVALKLNKTIGSLLEGKHIDSVDRIKGGK